MDRKFLHIKIVNIFTIVFLLNIPFMIFSYIYFKSDFLIATSWSVFVVSLYLVINSLAGIYLIIEQEAEERRKK